MRTGSSTMRMTATLLLAHLQMTDWGAQTPIPMAGLTRMKVGLQTTEQTPSQPNRLSGLILTMMALEIISMGSNPTTAHTAEDIPNLTALVVQTRMEMVGLMLIPEALMEQNRGLLIQMAQLTLSRLLQVSGMILMQMALEIIGQMVHGTIHG